MSFESKKYNSFANPHACLPKNLEDLPGIDINTSKILKEFGDNLQFTNLTVNKLVGLYFALECNQTSFAEYLHNRVHLPKIFVIELARSFDLKFKNIQSEPTYLSQITEDKQPTLNEITEDLRALALSEIKSNKYKLSDLKLSADEIRKINKLKIICNFNGISINKLIGLYFTSECDNYLLNNYFIYNIKLTETKAHELSQYISSLFHDMHNYNIASKCFCELPEYLVDISCLDLVSINKLKDFNYNTTYTNISIYTLFGLYFLLEGNVEIMKQCLLNRKISDKTIDYLIQIINNKFSEVLNTEVDNLFNYEACDFETNNQVSKKHKCCIL
jgi:hypothetical protein